MKNMKKMCMSPMLVLAIVFLLFLIMSMNMKMGFNHCDSKKKM